MTNRRKSWEDLTPDQQRLVLVGGFVEVVLTAVALVDLVRRPAPQVRGPKWAWGLAMVVQPFGPLAYFGLGRRAAEIA